MGSHPSQVGAFCDDKNPNTTNDQIQSDCSCSGTLSSTDNDQDGFSTDVDCDDNNPSINPSATEIANSGTDENCDGISLIIDNDQDGYNSSIDCDDNNPNVNGGVTEIPNNGIDEDCNGEDLIMVDNSCVERDRAALVTIYTATNGPNWSSKTNWLTSSPLREWHGVSTDAQGCVISLDLYNNQLSGAIPKELAQLTNLTDLSLSNNQLSGSIPKELAQLANLTKLSLAKNKLSGSIPTELDQLTNLISLDLAINQLIGSIPKELAQLTNLKTLYLYTNQLSGSIPKELAQLTNLTKLYLAYNRLSGSIPTELAQLTNLTTLSLNWNRLSGCFPTSLKNLCYSDYVFTNNPQLPWQGDFARFCNNESQIGATCDDGDTSTENDNIQADCGCRGTPIAIDNDGDSYNSNEDCDDSNSTIHPTAVEIPNNGIDEDCNGEDLVMTIDNDQDGYTSTVDCDDNNATIHPNATEIPNNDIDEDCNGEDLITSTLPTALAKFTWLPQYINFDNCTIEKVHLYESKGFLYLLITTPQSITLYNEIGQLYCTQTPSFICTDIYIIEKSMLRWTCAEGTQIASVDEDQDGFPLETDCDDTNPAINPAANDIPNNGIDEDCNGEDAISSCVLSADLFLSGGDCGEPGLIAISVNGGTPNYTISWSGASTGIIELSNNTYVIQDLPAGVYTILIEDGNACQTRIDTTLGSNGVTMELNAFSGKCSPFGSIEVDIIGGQAAYTIECLGPTTRTDTSDRPFYNIRDLRAGDYTVIITDATGCAISKMVSLEDRSSRMTMEVKAQPIYCNELGEITIKIAEGLAPYALEWNGETTGKKENNFNGVFKIDSLFIGEYDISIIDNNGCDQKEVIEIHNESLYFCLEDRPMNDGSGNHTLLVNVKNSTDTPYQLKVVGEAEIPTQQARATDFQQSNIPAGTYMIEVTDEEGCHQSQTYTIGQNANTIFANICEGDFYAFGEEIYTQSGVYNIPNCVAGTEWLNLTVESCDSFSPTYTTNKQVFIANDPTPMDASPSMTLFPNPATHQISLQFKDFSTPIIPLRILTLTGIIVYQQEVALQNAMIQLPISEFPAGTYIVQAIDGSKGIVVKKLFVK